MLASPCTGLCQIAENGFCRGCARTRAEIGAWRNAGEDGRRRVWDQLPERRAALGIRLHRKDWSAGVLRDHVAASLRRGGAWSIGSVEFGAGEGEVRINGGAIRCVSPLGALAFNLDAAIPFGLDGEETLILAAPRAETPNPVLRRLGPDCQAVREQDRAGMLYDLGLGDAALCLRTSDPALIARLDALAGREGRSLNPLLAEDFGGVHWVALGPIGRIEVFREPPPLFTWERGAPKISPAYVACAIHRTCVRRG